MAEKPNHGAESTATNNTNRAARSERFKKVVRETPKGKREEDSERYLPNTGRR